jgi:hypothetical protein
MRRTVGLLAGAVALVALAGVAGAQAVRPDAAPGGGPAAGLADTAGGLLRDVLSPAAGLGAAIPSAGLGESGRQRIGAVERIGRLLRGPGESATIRRPGAPYVKVHLAAARPGGTVTVADPSGAEVHRYEARTLAGRGGRWAMSITGDTAVVTVDRGSVEIDRVARGFTAGELADQRRADRERADRERAVGSGRPGVTGREESICGGDDKSDAVCYRDADPAIYRRSKAVVRLLINGNELCTGWRVGTRNRLITNHHCFADSRSAYNTEVWFNYQCAACGGFAVFRPTKVWGDQVLATDRTLDLTVFTVEDFAEVEKFGHLDLEQGRPDVGEEVAIPQHPAGDPTMIAARSDEDRSGACAVADPAYDGYAQDSDVSYYCDTEAGSSGSPVLSRRTGRVIALHHFGGCPNSGVRADLVYRHIEHLL